MDYRIEIYNEPDKIEQIWKEFQESGECYVFQTFEWVTNWINTIGKINDSELFIVLLYSDDDRLLMLLPLCIEKRYFIRVLTWTGGDYGNGIYDKELYDFMNKESFQDIWYEIKKKIENYDLIDLRNQPSKIGDLDNPFVFNLDTIPSYSNSNFIFFDSSWEGYFSGIKKKLKQDTNRQIKRLKQLGKLDFVVPENQDDVKIFTDNMIELKEQRYLMTGAKNVLKYEEYRKFYSDFINNNKSIILHISGLLLDDKIIAVHWGMIFKNRFYYLMPANEWDNYSKYSPGRILLIHLLRHSYNRGYEIFDFTVGSEAYKDDWTNSSMLLRRYFCAGNIKGWLVRCLIKLHYSKKQKQISR